MANSWTLAASGTTTPTVGALTTLTTNTTNGTFCFEIDPTAVMVLGDLLETTILTKTLTGGTEAPIWFDSCQDVQFCKKVSPFVASDIEIQIKINQVAGTARAFPWKLLII